MKYVFIFTFLMMMTSAHACTLTSILPSAITGNTDYELNYSCAQPGTALFVLQSPYELLNGTPELDYIYIADNCQNETTNDTIILVCPDREYNTSVRFRLAPNILPGEYTFLFGQVPVPEQPKPPAHSGGSSGTTRHYTNTKTVILDIGRQYDGFDYNIFTNRTQDNDTIDIDLLKSTMNVSEYEESLKWYNITQNLNDSDGQINPVWWQVIFVCVCIVGVITIVCIRSGDKNR